jgi:hypothetical protein
MSLADDVRCIYWAFDSGDSRREEVVKMAKDVARLERARDDLLAALKVFADERTVLSENHYENALRLIRSIEGV